MVQDKRTQSALSLEGHQVGDHAYREASCLYAVMTAKRPVSRRNRASWYLRRLNKLVSCDKLVEDDHDDNRNNSETKAECECDDSMDENINKFHDDGPTDDPVDDDIRLISVTTTNNYSDLQLAAIDKNNETANHEDKFIVTPNTRVLYLSKSLAVSIILDLSPSVVSVSSKNDCILSDVIFDALKVTLHLLVEPYELPSSGVERLTIEPKVFVSVIAYTPFLTAKTNQVLVQNRRISPSNIDQVSVELWISLSRLLSETRDLISTSGGGYFGSSRGNNSAFIFSPHLPGNMMRHPGEVLDDILELGVFSTSLLPRLSRRSVLVISDGLFSFSNNLSTYRLKNIALSFISLTDETTYPDSCFGYTPSIDLMKFIATSTLGFHLSYRSLLDKYRNISKLKPLNFLSNPLNRLFCWTLHKDAINENSSTPSPRGASSRSSESTIDPISVPNDQIARFFCADRPAEHPNSEDKTNHTGHHDWKLFRQMKKNLDADFEQVLSWLLREGYIIKSIQFKHKEVSKIVARLVLHWRYNLDLERELTAPFWNSSSPFEISDNRKHNSPIIPGPIYGSTYCEVLVHGSYGFLLHLLSDRRGKRRSEYRDVAYKQFKQLIEGVNHAHERLQYLSRYYKDFALSQVPSFLLHGNSLLYEQPHTHRLTTTVENVADEAKTKAFQEYWQKLSYLDTRSWKNLMHIHTLRLVLGHDQPKFKNIHYQNANGRYTHVQCRRALSAISNFIKEYASFALLEDSTYIKFISHQASYMPTIDDLREIENSATKGFIVIRINKLLPIIVIYLMFTSGIPDSQRTNIVSYIENQLINCRLKDNNRNSSISSLKDNIIKMKTIAPSKESCCILIRSPLETMLKVYHRNFVEEFLINNWAYGLPGSCPYNFNQAYQKVISGHDTILEREKPQREDLDLYSSTGGLMDNYNLVFGKYLCGVRVVHSISNLPHEVVPSMASSVLSKISAILVNLRIKQGFHIAFNNSGILNLVLELTMADHSYQDHHSNCLSQYVVFPPTITNYQSVTIQENSSSSKPPSLSGSFSNNTDSYLRSAPHELEAMTRIDNGEIKMIKEYWVEQQYGASVESEDYHPSLYGMRYPEIADHLYHTDKLIFECLLTYDLLLLLCDKLSPYYTLDESFSKTPTSDGMSPIFSPTTSITSSNFIETTPSNGNLSPSYLIEGKIRGPQPRIPLIELEYKFSIINFLDLCQMASLNILLFRDQSEYFSAPSNDLDQVNGLQNQPEPVVKQSSQRKFSMDVNDQEKPLLSRREHRSSYHMENLSTTSNTQVNNVASPSLNHLFLETLHRRLKQIHDKELKLPDWDRKSIAYHLIRRKLALDSALKIGARSGRSRVLINCQDKDDSVFDTSDEENDSNGFIDIEWRCYLRKGNQDTQIVTLMPANLLGVNRWLEMIHKPDNKLECQDPICPAFIFRCSSAMMNETITSFLNESCGRKNPINGNLLDEDECDLTLHFGQPCQYLGLLMTKNDELTVDPLRACQVGSDEKLTDLLHFRTFLKKVKNTVLKSRFNSLSDAYLGELFIHKNDILYYINNVDMEIQRKYHVASHLKYLAEFITNYQQYNDSLPKQPIRPTSPLLNSILLQKCGIFFNQPLARYNESNPLMRQLHDRRLLTFIRRNFKVDLPILSEKLACSPMLREFVKQTNVTSSTAVFSPINENGGQYSAAMFENSKIPDSKCAPGTSPGSSSYAERHKRFPNRSSGQFHSGTLNLSNESFILEAFKGANHCSMLDVPSIENLLGPDNVASRHEAHLAEVIRQNSLRKESHQYRRILKPKTNYTQSHSAIDQALKRVDDLGRLEHFCLTPLLFSPEWRSKLAPVRDHTLEFNRSHDDDEGSVYSTHRYSSINNIYEPKLSDSFTGVGASDVTPGSSLSSGNHLQTIQQDHDERWHQLVCNNYLKEYEQYIQTLGFNSIQIRIQSSVRNVVSTQQQNSYNRLERQRGSDSFNPNSSSSPNTGSSFMRPSNYGSSARMSRGSNSTSNTSLLMQTNTGSSSGAPTYNTGYLIKFLNSGCLVFKVGFCKPYVYSILYSIEGERFNSSNLKTNMTAFLDELDNIKSTMHLHSFTYDYHLRSMYSYISGRQLSLFSPGYHLISFLDEFLRYYQKAPNYARNHILSDQISIQDLKVTGQQLYNYIITHNTSYHMKVAEMSQFLQQSLASGFSNSRKFITDIDLARNLADSTAATSQGDRNHANDYVLIELKREKIRYRDGKDPDIFDCGLMITHDFHHSNMQKNGLTLRYFFIMTNQRDLYPKLVHTYDNILSFGCHKPIRLGLPRLRTPRKISNTSSSSLMTSQSEMDETQSSSVMLNSVELSVEPINDSNAIEAPASSVGAIIAAVEKSSSLSSSSSLARRNSMGPEAVAKFQIGPSESELEAAELKNENGDSCKGKDDNEILEADRAIDKVDPAITVDLQRAKKLGRDDMSNGNSKSKSTLATTTTTTTTVSTTTTTTTTSNTNTTTLAKGILNGALSQGSRTICDEEITYLGYFSTDEMDMLKFLQEKTANLKSHIEEIVRSAEIHYRRDYLWHKLMQRNVSQKSDEIPLANDELAQLLTIVDSIDLSTLDPQLSPFATMHLSWYIKLVKAFNDLKQSSINEHRIFVAKTTKLLLLYIDPKCTGAFILLSIDSERSSIELNLMLKDKSEILKASSSEQKNPNCSKTSSSSSSSIKNSDHQSLGHIELDRDCQQLINDFINFCATFMWSTFLG